MIEHVEQNAVLVLGTAAVTGLSSGGQQSQLLAQHLTYILVTVANVFSKEVLIYSSS